MVSVKEKVDYFFHSFKKNKLLMKLAISELKKKKTAQKIGEFFFSDDVLEIKSFYRLETKNSEEDYVI